MHNYIIFAHWRHPLLQRHQGRFKLPQAASKPFKGATWRGCRCSVRPQARLGAPIASGVPLGPTSSSPRHLGFLPIGLLHTPQPPLPCALVGVVTFPTQGGSRLTRPVVYLGRNCLPVSDHRRPTKPLRNCEPQTLIDQRILCQIK